MPPDEDPALPFPGFALLAALLLCPPAIAEESRWYQVELLIVAHTDPAAAGAEAWPPLPELQYPETVRFLVDPAQIQHRLQQYPAAGSSELDELGRQHIFLLPELTAEQQASLEATIRDQPAVPDIPRRGAGEPGAANAGDEPLASDPGDAGVDVADAAAVDPKEAAEPAPRLPTPFVQLPATAREFRGKAAYMERTGKYRILYHQVWWQPVTARKQALPLVLDQSGDAREYPPLQGTITLSRSRYLHLDTRLWLNTDGDYLPGDWRMPAPPLSPPSLVLVEAPPLLPLSEPLHKPDYPSSPTAFDAASESDAEPEPVATPQYPYRHAVLLEQQRRMRSNEVHYIDHPLLGIVVKLTPLDEDELATADYDRALLPYLPGKTTPAATPAESPAGS
ncbi:CsiV family protein [Kineobactrum salinum]|uniref:Uncharacterized protein n=1 Tax=Kineobactrum salinum TaxID=2708301 RepID=A0A6C0U7M8_9GAMM|nr:CsiV family protein [Kineobactrum salinum]QIB67349.1 hypothetical protein G3T16_20070 [Kineobactrum salinum]